MKGPEVLNYLVDHGINIEEVDVGGMGAGMIEVYYTKISLLVQKKMISSEHY